MINQEKAVERKNARMAVVRGFKENARGMAPMSMPTSPKRSSPWSQSEWSVHLPGKRWFTWCAATPPRSPLKTAANQRLIAWRDAAGALDLASQMDRTNMTVRNTLEIIQSTIAIVQTAMIRGGIPPA